jgi:hypothetical protein
VAEYGKLLSRIWADPQFVALDARPQQVFCLLISYSTRNLAGILPLTLKRWVKCTADAVIDNLTQALIVLAANNFIIVDWDTEEVLIRTFIRNDEVYRQPNLMKAALRFALQVESEAIRWVLHDELNRLPEHKDSDKTEMTANMLVAGLTRTPSEGLPEGFREGLLEPPGVGVTYVGNQNTSTYTEHQHQHLQPQPIPEPLDSVAATSGAELVRRAIPKEQPAAVQTALRLRASELVNTGTPPDIVEEALRDWATRTGIGPGVLPSLAADVIKRRNGHARAAPNGIGKPTEKALGWQAAADELIAEMGQE